MRYSIDAIAKKMNVSSEDVKTLLDSRQSNETLSKKDYENFIENVYSVVSDFVYYKINTSLIKEALSSVIPFNKNKLSLIELCKIQDHDVKYSFIPKIVRDLTSQSFRKQSFLNKNTLINKEITELLFKYPVEANWIPVHSDDGSDSERLSLQYRTEIYSDGSGEQWESLKTYSTNMSDAWEIVEHFAKLGLSIRLSNKSFGNEFWWCYINDDEYCSQETTACLAICNAALKYVKEKEEKS